MYLHFLLFRITHVEAKRHYLGFTVADHLTHKFSLKRSVGRNLALSNGYKTLPKLNGVIFFLTPFLKCFPVKAFMSGTLV